jgi:hypothetical protein
MKALTLSLGSYLLPDEVVVSRNLPEEVEVLHTQPVVEVGIPEVVRHRHRVLLDIRCTASRYLHRQSWAQRRLSRQPRCPYLTCQTWTHKAFDLA